MQQPPRPLPHATEANGEKERDSSKIDPSSSSRLPLRRRLTQPHAADVDAVDAESATVKVQPIEAGKTEPKVSSSCSRCGITVNSSHNGTHISQGIDAPWRHLSASLLKISNIYIYSTAAVAIYWRCVSIPWGTYLWGITWVAYESDGKRTARGQISTRKDLFCLVVAGADAENVRWKIDWYAGWMCVGRGACWLGWVAIITSGNNGDSPANKHIYIERV